MSVWSRNVYLAKRGLPKDALRKGCGFGYRNKRWQAETRHRETPCEVLRTACQRREGHNPGGVVTLSGPRVSRLAEDNLNKDTYPSLGVEAPEGKIAPGAALRSGGL
jgi:hypothetical protein